MVKSVTRILYHVVHFHLVRIRRSTFRIGPIQVALRPSALSLLELEDEDWVRCRIGRLWRPRPFIGSRGRTELAGEDG